MINHQELEINALFGITESLEAYLEAKEFNDESGDHFSVLFEEEDNVADAVYAKLKGWA